MLKVVVEPAKQDLFWREFQEVLKGLSVLQETSQARTVLEGDLGKQANLQWGREEEEEEEEAEEEEESIKD